MKISTAMLGNARSRFYFSKLFICNIENQKKKNKGEAGFFENAEFTVSRGSENLELRINENEQNHGLSGMFWQSSSYMREVSVLSYKLNKREYEEREGSLIF